MLFNEKDRSAKVLIEGLRSRSLNCQQSFDVFIDLNNAVLRLCIESIKHQEPGISGQRLLNEVRRIYALR